MRYWNAVHLDDYLEHYGVKGIKWGVRRTPEQLGHRTNTSYKKQISETLKKEKKSFL